LLFAQALFDELTLEFRQAGLQQVAIALDIASMCPQASQVLINHLSSPSAELIPFTRHSALSLRSECQRSRAQKSSGLISMTLF
jgi:hypothetical protein